MLWFAFALNKCLRKKISNILYNPTMFSSIIKSQSGIATNQFFEGQQTFETGQKRTNKHRRLNLFYMWYALLITVHTETEE